MRIAVRNRRTVLLSDDTLIQNARKPYTAEFRFDGEWDGFGKTAVFETASSRAEAALTEDRCLVPPQCLSRAGATLRVGVCGTKDGRSIRTDWCLAGKVLHPANLDIGTSPFPELPDDVYAQIIALIRASTATDREVEEVLNGAFGSGSTAADNEVEAILNDVFGGKP